MVWQVSFQATHPALLLSDGSASFLSKFGLSGSLPLQDFRKLSWSIFIILSKDGPLFLFQPEATFFILCLEQMNLPRGETPLPLLKNGRRRGSDFAGPDACSFPYPFFFIIKASTANQGKRKHLSFFYIHLTANKSNLLFSHQLFSLTWV